MPIYKYMNLTSASVRVLGPNNRYTTFRPLQWSTDTWYARQSDGRGPLTSVLVTGVPVLPPPGLTLEEEANYFFSLLGFESAVTRERLQEILTGILNKHVDVSAAVLGSKLADASVLASKLGYAPDSTVVVQRGSTEAASGVNLVAVFAAATALTPGNSALSITNYATVLIPPGRYELAAEYVLDSTYEFLELVGMGAGEVRILADISGGTVLRQMVGNMRFANLVVENESSDANSQAFVIGELIAVFTNILSTADAGADTVVSCVGVGVGVVPGDLIGIYTTESVAVDPSTVTANAIYVIDSVDTDDQVTIASVNLGTRTNTSGVTYKAATNQGSVYENCRFLTACDCAGDYGWALMSFCDFDGLWIDCEAEPRGWFSYDYAEFKAVCIRPKVWAGHSFMGNGSFAGAWTGRVVDAVIDTVTRGYADDGACLCTAHATNVPFTGEIRGCRVKGGGAADCVSGVYVNGKVLDTIVDGGALTGVHSAGCRFGPNAVVRNCAATERDSFSGGVGPSSAATKTVVSGGAFTLDAQRSGNAGNSIRLKLVDSPPVSVSVAGMDITVDIDAGVTDVTAIKAAIDGDVDAHALVSVSILNDIACDAIDWQTFAGGAGYPMEGRIEDCWFLPYADWADGSLTSGGGFLLAGGSVKGCVPGAGRTFAANYEPSVLENGGTFLNTAAAGNIEVSLPPATPGFRYTIVQKAAVADRTRIQPEGVDVIRGVFGTSSEGVAGGKAYISAAEAGAITLVCLDDGFWDAVAFSGTWAVA